MKLPDSFWNFNIGHVGTIGVCLVSCTLAWANLNSDHKQLRKEHDALVIEVHAMDERGTRASQKGIYQESEQSKENQRRLETLESAFREMGPKVERIDVSIGFLLKSQGIQPPK